MTTTSAAYDLVCGLIKDAWAASATTSSIPISWEATPADKPGEDDHGYSDPYARVFVTANGGQQDSMGAPGAARFLDTGLITVQIFVKNGAGKSQLRAIADVVMTRLRRPPTGFAVWFRDVGLVEVGVDGNHYNGNVVATYEHQQIA